jgi:hypothetical protein
LPYSSAYPRNRLQTEYSTQNVTQVENSKLLIYRSLTLTASANYNGIVTQ